MLRKAIRGLNKPFTFVSRMFEKPFLAINTHSPCMGNGAGNGCDQSLLGTRSLRGVLPGAKRGCDIGIGAEERGRERKGNMECPPKICRLRIVWRIC